MTRREAVLREMSRRGLLHTAKLREDELKSFCPDVRESDLQMLAERFLRARLAPVTKLAEPFKEALLSNGALAETVQAGMEAQAQAIREGMLAQAQALATMAKSIALLAEAIQEQKPPIFNVPKAPAPAVTVAVPKIKEVRREVTRDGPDKPATGTVDTYEYVGDRPEPEEEEDLL